MTQPRSSLAIAHILMLRNARDSILDGRQTMQTLHTYNAALEVWRQVAATPETEHTFPERLRLRDSIAAELVGEILADLEGGQCRDPY